MASGGLNPFDNPQAYDVVSVGGVTSPGVIPPGGIVCKRAHEWDVKKGKGAHGATLSYVQRPPAKGSIRFILATRAHFEQWESFRGLFKYDPTKKVPNAVDVFHPVLADIDVHSVVTESIGALENDGYGQWSCTVEFIEYFPPPKVSGVGTPTTSQTNTKTAGPVPNVQLDAQDEQQQEIAKLLAEASKP